MHLTRAIEEGEEIPPAPYEVTEKLDGANAGIVYLDKGLLLHSRNTFLAFLSFYEGVPDDIQNNFNGFVSWVEERKFKIRGELAKAKTPDHIYGEWLVPHTVRYPDEMYRQFYAFDLIWDGVIPTVPKVGEIEARLQEAATTLLEEYSKGIGRPIEGIVITPKSGGPYRSRFKVVLPEFRENHKKSTNPASRANDTEVQLAGFYPVRSYQKIKERVADHNEGVLKMSHTGAVLGQCYQDYLNEFFVPALKKVKPGDLNMRRLQAEVQGRVREMWLSEMQLGQLPAWAESELYRAKAA
jgi:hypothetical protein